MFPYIMTHFKYWTCTGSQPYIQFLKCTLYEVSLAAIDVPIYNSTINIFGPVLNHNLKLNSHPIFIYLFIDYVPHYIIQKQ